MSDEVHLTAEAAAIADRIRSIDRRLDEIERRTQEFTERSMPLAGTFIGTAQRLQWRDDRDTEHQRLVEERAGLVIQLKHPGVM